MYWKCDNETPCIAMLNKQKHVVFFKQENVKVKQVLSGGWYQCVWGGYKERVLEGQCRGNITYSCMKMEK
jgi:hypothetical protein